MKKLAFIDHSFHQKSTATQFLIHLFKNYFHFDVYWDESWNKKPRLDLSSFKNKKYDVIIFFQMMNYTINEILLADCKNIIMIPMYDGILNFPDSYWLRYNKLKFLNFSSTLHKKLIHLGLNSKYVRYFPSPESFASTNSNYKKLNGFFWQRTSQITWRHVKNLIAHTEFNNFHIHAAIDPPGYEFIEPTEEERSKYNISISEWFEHREDYFAVVSKANVFFAPRPYEGIGMSFLEAMAQGKCVVAPNNPTMNEYITHGVNGYLYDLQNQKPIDFSNAEEVGENARQFIKKGHKQWEKQQLEILEFIEQPAAEFHISIIYYLRKIIAELKYNSLRERIKFLLKRYFPALTIRLIEIKKRIKQYNNSPTHY